jgi:hypothetical protein
MISEVDINDNSDISSKKVLYSPDEINKTDSEEDVDINNKIKQSEENDNMNVCKGGVLKFEDEYENEYPSTGGKNGYDTSVNYNDDDELNEEEERLIMEDQQEYFLDKNEFDCDSEYQNTQCKCSKNIINKL